jgi:hypothetical protein
MKALRALPLLALAALLLPGCDESTGPSGGGPDTTVYIDSVKVDYLGENNSVFYCLSTMAKTTIPHDVWDIAIDGDLVIVSNSGDYGFGVGVIATGETSFDDDYSSYADSAFDGEENISWEDLNPFEGWMTYNPQTHEVTYSNEVFIISTEDGQFYKVQFTEVTYMSGVSLTAKIDGLSGTGASGVTFDKDAAYDRAYIDLGTQAVVPFAPPTTEWDLKFARGNQLIEIGGGQYILHGMSAISLNPFDSVVAYVLEETNFDDVTTVEESLFSGAINVIGNSWYTFEGGHFYVDNDVSVIRTSNGTYKLQMLTFYGGPNGDEQFSSIFQFQELEE